jgi:hypothetical protein
LDSSQRRENRRPISSPVMLTPHHLRAVRDHTAHRLVGEAHGDAGVEQRRQPLIGTLRVAVGQQARRLGVDLHLGQPQLHRLEVDRRLAELLALLGLGQRNVERARRDAQRAGLAA